MTKFIRAGRTLRRAAWTRVHRDQLASLARATPAAMAGYALNVVLAILAFYRHASGPELAVWAATALAICSFVGFRSIRRRRTGRRIRPPDTRLRSALGAYVFAILLGLPWALLTAWVGVVPTESEIILLALIVGMAASGGVLLSPVPIAAVIYTSTILVPVIVKSLFVLGGHYLLLGALAASFLLFLYGLIATNARLFLERLRALEQLQESCTALTEARQETERVAMTDGLTGVANRRAFMARLRLLGFENQTNPDYAIFYIDLDRFKSVNDGFGHAIGDAVLRTAALRISDAVREDDMVARIGGDEFAIVAEGIFSRTAASALAERLVEALTEPYHVDQEQKIAIGACVGVALASESRVDGELLLKQADLAMYAAKNAGRGCFCIFEPDMQRSAEERHALEDGLKWAITNGEFELFYQPIRRLESGAITGFESLIRWRHPVRGLMSPAQFLTIAEEIGMADDIADWVLQEACQQATRWPVNIVVGVNMSPLQIGSGDIVKRVETALKATRLPARRLEIEITETSLLESDPETIDSLNRLQNMGVSIALDDFGAGYSSLSYLVSFPFNRIKIDRLFVSQLGLSRQSDLIIRSVVRLAKTLRCDVVAEGIEKDEHWRRLRTLNVSHGQGYLLGKPLSATETARLLAEETSTLLAETA